MRGGASWRTIDDMAQGVLPSAAAMACVLLAATSARGDAIDDLSPGTWYEIPNTNMRDVCPPDSADYDWSFYCANAIAAWNGGVLDTARGRLIVWGGGHGDYKGNEVYAFDLQSLTWARIWGPTPDAQIPSGGTHEVYDDGNPGSRHTYSGLTYLPEPYDAMISMGGALWQTGFYGAGVWRYELGSDSWTRLADGPGEQSYGDPSVFDPETEHVFRRGNSRMYEYDPATDTFMPRAPSDGGFWASNVSADLDLATRTMVIVGEGRLDLYHLDTDTYEQDVALEGAGVSELFGNLSPGVAWDPQQERMVVWGGGLDVYTFDVDARAFSQHAGAGDDPGEITPSGGAFGRFRYAPSRNVFVYVDHVDKNVFVYRMSKGTGEPPDPPGDDESGGSEGSSGSDGGTTEDGTTGGNGPPSTSSGGDDTPTSGGVPGSAGATDSGGADGGGSDEGCGCRSGRPGSWLPLLLLALVRRRVSPDRRDRTRRRRRT